MYFRKGTRQCWMQGQMNFPRPSVGVTKLNQRSIYIEQKTDEYRTDNYNIGKTAERRQSQRTVERKDVRRYDRRPATRGWFRNRQLSLLCILQAPHENSCSTAKLHLSLSIFLDQDCPRIPFSSSFHENDRF